MGAVQPGAFSIIAFFLLALAFGAMMALPGSAVPTCRWSFRAVQRLTGSAVAWKAACRAERGDDHRGTVVGAAGSAADAADGEGHEPPDQQRAVLESAAAAVRQAEEEVKP